MNTLGDLKIGEKGIIKEISPSSELRRRLMDIGFLKGEEVLCTLKSFGGGMTAYEIKGTVIALREKNAREILIFDKEEVI